MDEFIILKRMTHLFEYKYQKNFSRQKINEVFLFFARSVILCGKYGLRMNVKAHSVISLI